MKKGRGTGKRTIAHGGKKPMKKKPAAMKRKSSSALVRDYTAGATLGELKKKYGIRGKTQLATAVLDSLIKEGKMPPLAPSGRGGAPDQRDFKVSVNRRGTLILPKEAVIEAFRAREGQAFTVRKRGRKIILTQA